MSAPADWLKLWHQPGLGPAGINRLLEHFGDPESILAASDSDWASAGLDNRQIRGRHETLDISADLHWLENTPNASILTSDSPDYPAQLAPLADRPPLLYTLGDASLLCWPQLAIVGSRHPSHGGRDNAREFAAHFARAGLAITSGLAMGIDSESHRAALDAGGKTVAVVGTGLDRTYPAKNRELARDIAAAGVLVSEFPIGTRARPENFPRRNRIISGLSLGTLVVEAAHRSGSLITARLASEQGREVFAIPGSIHNPMARGCHRLIRDGAKLVESASDVLDEIGSMVELSIESTRKQLDETPKSVLEPTQQAVLDAVAYDPTDLETILQRSGCDYAEAVSTLSILEIAGLVHAEPGGYYTRSRS